MPELWGYIMKFVTKVAIATAILGGSPATATNWVFEANGILQGGTDTLGIFTSTNTNLFGYAYSVKVVYDITGGARVTNSNEDTLIGGSAFGQPWPVSQATLTINGVTNDLGLGTLAVVANSDQFKYFIFYNMDGGLFNRLEFVFSDPSFVKDLEQQVPLTSTPVYSGGFNWGPAGGSQGIWSTSPTEISWSALPQTAAIPEPANWALLIAGFGLAGAMMRRRRHAAAIA